MESILSRLDALRDKMADEAFLSNKGLSNEVGLYVFAYSPREEMAVRHFIQNLQNENEASGESHFKIYDLYEILLSICRERRILDRIPQMEVQRGASFMLQQIQRVAPPEAYVERMKYEKHCAGDVVIITGIGRVFPYMRSHNILNNLQHVFDDVPVVLFYPGEYTGQTLTLFEKFMDDNYYGHNELTDMVRKADKEL